MRELAESTGLLPPSKYGSARTILRALDIHLVVDAILAGRTEGQIYVDDLERPSAALVQRRHRYYLAVQKVQAGAALLSYWDQVLYPRAQAAGHEMYVLYAASEEWAPLIEETLAARTPIPAPREYWALPMEMQTKAPPLPAGYRVVHIDKGLLHDTGLSHLDDLQKEIDSEHASSEAFLERSFGVCALYEGREIAGWCLAEYSSAARCEVGIETLHPHRRRGLGTAMTVALVEQARARGLSHVGWHSYTRNDSSIATARKAGLSKVCDYPAYIGHFDPLLHLSEHGYTAVGQGRAAEGLAWLEKAFVQGAAPGWAYYAAACACAALGHHDQAFGYLDRAVEQGFAERSIYESSEMLQSLHGRSEWIALLARLGEPDGPA
jgi:GNAT superfamily N-acetyltransferase